MAGRGRRGRIGRNGPRGGMDYGWGVPVRGMYDYSLDYGSLGGPETDSESIPGYETEPPDWMGPMPRYESQHWAAREPAFEPRFFDEEPGGWMGGDRPRWRRWARPDSGEAGDWLPARARAWRDERGTRGWSPYRARERSRGYDALYDDDAYRAPYGFEGVFADRPRHRRDDPWVEGGPASRPGFGRDHPARVGRGPSSRMGPTPHVPDERAYDRVFRSTGPGPQWRDWPDRLDRDPPAGRRSPRGEPDQRPWPLGPWRSERYPGRVRWTPPGRRFRGGVAPIDD